MPLVPYTNYLPMVANHQMRTVLERYIPTTLLLLQTVLPNLATRFHSLI
jgi:hypothetical protein